MATPVLACVPTSAMTDDEMGCCKKMAGNCDMGAGNHSCCKNTMNRAPSVTAIANNPQLDLPLVATTAANVYDYFSPKHDEEAFLLTAGPLGIPPLGLKPILRI